MSLKDRLKASAQRVKNEIESSREAQAENERVVPSKYVDNVKTYIVPANLTGRLHLAQSSRPGERVQMGKKLYEIKPDGSLKRIDKVRVRK